jgi:serine kinase of HPr protein (carbohydrate metabolism regulator)
MSAGYRLLIGDEIVGESAELQIILEQLRRELMVHVAERAPELVFVHAGVVGWKGRAVVLPGMSFAGKTTLVAELVRLGATYYSDEYAVIDACGRVHPYARELQMRTRGGVEQRGVSVAELGGVAAKRPARVSHVVFTEYAEGARWEPERMSRGSAVLEMMRHSIALQRAPARVMAALAKMMETAEAVRGVRGEASEMAQWMLDAVSA